MTIWNMEITASESPQTVHIPIEGKYYAIKNTGESDILVSSYVANPTEGADDVMKIPSGSSGVIPVKDGDLNVSAEEDGAYSVSIQDDKVIPWSGGTGSGGGSSDNTHYKGTTTTPLENGSTTNPIIIDGESYTAVFGDVVVYGYTEFVFDGTAWSEFGRPFDTVPTQGSTNAVTSNGIYAVTPLKRGTGLESAYGGQGTYASGNSSFAYGYQARTTKTSCIAVGNQAEATGNQSAAFGMATRATQGSMLACGRYNKARSDDLFNIGNGSGSAASSRSNIVEVDSTSANVNGDIQINGVNIPTPYTTMPTITASMLGKIAMYVGATENGYVQGCFYIAATDGAAEPTYSWVKIGSGRTETVLWENSGTTNPPTITLSEAWSDFDEIVVYDGGNETGISSNIYVQSVLSQNAVIGIIEDESRRVWYRIASSTTLTKVDEDTPKNIALHSIIGIKY